MVAFPCFVPGATGCNAGNTAWKLWTLWTLIISRQGDALLLTNFHQAGSQHRVQAQGRFVHKEEPEMVKVGCIQAAAWALYLVLAGFALPCLANQLRGILQVGEFEPLGKACIDFS